MKTKKDKVLKKKTKVKTLKKIVEPVKEKNLFKFNAKKIPTKSGVYLFWDKNEKLLYVGKSKALRKRVSSYFQKTKKSTKTDLMMAKITKIETRITNSEMESLILENNLIKEFRPKFNVLLRDDKNFLYLRISNDQIPRLEITRKILRDGAFYVGPKTSAKKFRDTIKFCQKIFRIRTCRLAFSPNYQVIKNPENRKLPCLDFHLRKCSAPCAGEISPEDYGKEVVAMKKFLRGNTAEILKNLREKMMKFAEEKNFEAAVRMRDTISSVETSTIKQNVQFDDFVDRDFVHFHKEKNSAFFVRIVFRGGKLLDQNEVEFNAPERATNTEILEKFLIQFYEKVDDAPREILVPEKIDDVEKVTNFLSEKFFSNAKISILVPQKGDKMRALEIAQKNAKHFADRAKIEKLSHAETFAKALPELAKVLKIKNLARIECIDISHFAGTTTVGSLVVFENGEPKNSEYRRFKIQSLKSGEIDDFAAIAEVTERRFRPFLVPEKQIEKDGKGKKKKKTKHVLPNLFVVDGGKGQLSSALKVFGDKKIKGFNPKKQVIALAKREEEIFTSMKKSPLEVDRDSSASKLLQRLRDEAHRFAISFNRSVRDKVATKSILDEIPGIGNATRKKLIKKFGSVSGVRKAEEKELKEILSATQIKNLRKII